MLFASGLIGYLLSSLIYMQLFKKAGIRNYGLAWIPIVNLWPLMWTIGKSSWNIIWFVIPVADFVFAIYVSWRLFTVFGRSGAHILWNLIPFLGSLIYLIIMLITAFDDNYRYQLPGPYGNSGSGVSM